jgi:hypothetical protein
MGRPGAPWRRPPPAPRGAPAFPSCTSLSCAQADAPGAPRVRLASVGPWRPGDRPGGAEGRSPPGRAPRFFVSSWHSAASSAALSALGAPLGASPDSPAPSRPSLPPRPPRLSAPPLSSSVPASGGQPPKEGGPSPPTQSPAPGGEGALELGSLLSAWPSSGAHGQQRVKQLIRSRRRHPTGCRCVSQSVHHGGGGAGCWRVLAATPGPGELLGSGPGATGAVPAAGSGDAPRSAVVGWRMVMVRVRGGMCAHVGPSEGCLCFRCRLEVCVRTWLAATVCLFLWISLCVYLCVCG